MTRTFREFFKQFQKSMEDVGGLRYFSRAKELQEAAVRSLAGALEAAEAAKKRLIEERDEDAANATLACEEALKTVRCEMSMWIALKEDRCGDAWNQLVEAEKSAERAARAHPIIDFAEYIQHLAIIEQALFPPQRFFSTSVTFKTALCSTCGNDFEICEHLPGYPYWGEFCSRLIAEVDSISEISLVERPADKGCRIVTLSEGGITRDFLTWRTLGEAKPPDDGTLSSEGLVFRKFEE